MSPHQARECKEIAESIISFSVFDHTGKVMIRRKYPLFFTVWYTGKVMILAAVWSLKLMAMLKHVASEVSRLLNVSFTQYMGKCVIMDGKIETLVTIFSASKLSWLTISNCPYVAGWLCSGSLVHAPRGTTKVFFEKQQLNISFPHFLLSPTARNKLSTTLISSGSLRLRAWLES
jgi:hypothetical protein